MNISPTLTLHYEDDMFDGRALSTYDKLTDIKYIDELSSLFDNHKINEKIMITLYTRSFVGGV